ncbi:hypothetical protein NQ318_005126 [Aromia moschata]|uniref:MICOS complex subunit MIC60 n=1 Tax=Aromia moschata TaxID=1265417 RepID=A0AAV8XS11_9CUCU|nr:hypothetical protein NQ318_005126 [Aromia moschata]
MISGGKQDTKIVLPPEPSEYKAPPPIVPALEKEAQKPEKTYREIRLEKKEGSEEELKVEIEWLIIPNRLEKSSKLQAKQKGSRLCELKENIRKSAEEAVNAYNKAVYILKVYNQDIEYIIDEAVNEIKPDTWERVKNKTRSKVECIKRAQEKAEEATKDINKLKELVSSQNFDAPRTTKELIKNNIAKVQEDIYNAKKELDLEQRKGNVTEKYWDKVEKARQHFSEEMESLFPSIDLSKKKLSISSEDLDLFVLHTYANILFYQKELAKMQTIINEKMQQAVEAARKGGGEPLTNAQICERSNRRSDD